CLLPALLSGALLWACHFPLSWGWLAWVALVPLLALIRSAARPWKVYLAAWLGAFGFFVATLQWMRVADEMMYITWILLALHCSLFFLVKMFLVRTLDRRFHLPLALTVPVVWSALEYTRAHFMTGFPWYFLGHTQHDFLPVIQISDVTGVYGVTFVVAAVNAVVLEWLLRSARFSAFLGLAEPERPGWRSPVWQTAFVGVLLAAVLGYGFWRLGQNEFE